MTHDFISGYPSQHIVRASLSILFNFKHSQSAILGKFMDSTLKFNTDSALRNFIEKLKAHGILDVFLGIELPPTVKQDSRSAAELSVP